MPEKHLGDHGGYHGLNVRFHCHRVAKDLKMQNEKLHEVMVLQCQ